MIIRKRAIVYKSRTPSEDGVERYTQVFDASLYLVRRRILTVVLVRSINVYISTLPVLGANNLNTNARSLMIATKKLSFIYTGKAFV